MRTMRKTVGTMLLASLAAIAMVACSSDPVAPTNENENKLHEDPTAAVFTLVEGKLKPGVKFTAYPQPKDFIPTGEKQTVYWEVVKGENFRITDKGLPRFTVKSTTDNPDVVYALQLEYYNVKGEKMNHQFFDNEQDKIHQHFFRYSVFDGTAYVPVRQHDKLPFDYTYADEHDGKFIGQTNPMGFYGFITFNGQSKKFDLSISLMHAGNVTKFDGNGQASPFWMPSASQIGKALWDLSVKLPIEVIG